MNIAILIDAENVLPAHADSIFDYAQSRGDIVRKEIFGAAQSLTNWVAPVLKYAIHANLTIKASKGKNASDIALVIGAMDMLLTGGVDAVIIASSDSDFSALSIRLRNAGIEVIGMGTEKSNEMWRTACTTFTVLKEQKAQAAKAQTSRSQAAKAPAPKEEAPAQPKKNGGKGTRQPASTHTERTAAIRALIEKRLNEHGGRVQVSTLFPTLNRMQEYRIDKQGSGKRPLNYLTSTFGEVFRFEEAADGQSWVSFADAAEASPAEPAATEAPAEEAAEPMEVETPAEVVEVEVPVEEVAEPIAEEADEADPLALLIGAGLSEEVAGQIVEIFTDSDNLRAAYNKLRSTFGNNTGREYYQLVKQIAEARQ